MFCDECDEYQLKFSYFVLLVFMLCVIVNIFSAINGHFLGSTVLSIAQGRIAVAQW